MQNYKGELLRHRQKDIVAKWLVLNNLRDSRPKWSHHMIKRTSFAFLILILLILSEPAGATTWSDKQLKCPICGTEDTYSVILSFGGYIYDWNSQYQYIFWPMADEHVLYACPKCHFTCLMDDFGKIQKNKVADIKIAIEGTKLSPPHKEKAEQYPQGKATYCFIPMVERIAIAEKVYRALGQTDDRWCEFYRMAAYHFDEARMYAAADEARKKALAIAEKLITEEKNTGRLKELYLISGSLRHFLKDEEGARKDFEKAVAAPYKDSECDAEQCKHKEKYLNSILTDFLAKGTWVDLILAIDSRNLEKAGELLERDRTLINAKDKYDRPLLLEIAEGGDKDVMELFISKGADINACDERGRTALHRASLKDHLDIVKLLIVKGADLAAKDDGGETPLHKATMNDDATAIEILDLLLQNGADVRATNHEGETALHSAAIWGSKRVSDFLISKGIDCNARNVKGQTPLHLAATSMYPKHLEVMKLLVSKGADINAEDNIGWTPLCYGIRRGYKQVDELLKLGAKRNAAAEIAEFFIAAENGDLKRFNTLLEKNPGYAMARDDNDITPLNIVITPLLPLHKQKEMVEMLISRGADVNAKDWSGKTPLLEALSSPEYKGIPEILVNAGADVNYADSSGWTPLHHAAFNNDEKLVEFIVSHGAHINAKDHAGKTPLRLAIEDNYNDIVKFLRSHGGEE